MSPVVAITVLLCAVIGGWLGWRRATRPPARGSLLERSRPGSGRRSIDPGQRRRVRLVIVTIIYALGGAALGFLVLAMLPHAAGAAMMAP